VKPRGSAGVRVAADFALWRQVLFVEPALELQGAFGPTIYTFVPVHGINTLRFGGGFGVGLLVALETH
jgi:hypothetical protein